MPADWWDSPTAVACPLSRGPQAARAARRVTRTALRDWGLGSLTDDAEAIVGEFVANAVRHASGGQVEVPRDGVGLRLMKRAGEVIFAVLDPSDAAPVLRDPSRNDESGRGLQMVDALSDIWGWSPVAGRGKAVWAILFCSLTLPEPPEPAPWPHVPLIVLPRGLIPRGLVRSALTPRGLVRRGFVRRGWVSSAI